MKTVWVCDHCKKRYEPALPVTEVGHYCSEKSKSWRPLKPSHE